MRANAVGQPQGTSTLDTKKRLGTTGQLGFARPVDLGFVVAVAGQRLGLTVVVTVGHAACSELFVVSAAAWQAIGKARRRAASCMLVIMLLLMRWNGFFRDWFCSLVLGYDILERDHMPRYMITSFAPSTLPYSYGLTRPKHGTLILPQRRQITLPQECCKEAREDVSNSTQITTKSLDLTNEHAHIMPLAHDDTLRVSAQLRSVRNHSAVFRFPGAETFLFV